MSLQNSNLPFLNMKNRSKIYQNYENSSKLLNSLSQRSDQNIMLQKQIRSGASPDLSKHLENITNIEIVKNDKYNYNTNNMKKNINSQTSQSKPNKSIEEQIGDEEYVLNLKKALEDAMNENDYLRNEAKNLKEENNKLKKEIEEKDDAIVELGAFYEYCLRHHKQDDFSDDDLDIGGEIKDKEEEMNSDK